MFILKLVVVQNPISITEFSFIIDMKRIKYILYSKVPT